MKLREWNARLHGLVVFRSLLDDPVIAKLMDLTDRMETGAPGCGPVCDAAAQFEAALFDTPPTGATTSALPCWKPRRSACAPPLPVLSARC